MSSGSKDMFDKDEKKGSATYTSTERTWQMQSTAWSHSDPFKVDLEIPPCSLQKASWSNRFLKRMYTEQLHTIMADKGPPIVEMKEKRASMFSDSISASIVNEEGVV